MKDVSAYLNHHFPRFNSRTFLRLAAAASLALIFPGYFARAQDLHLGAVQDFPYFQQSGAGVAQPTPLLDLVSEAEADNPDIMAAVHGWRAGAHVSKQVSSLPDPQFTVQQFSVGSPRPFAGFTNSNFAYIGFGASQDIPYPGKRDLRAQVANREADSLLARSDAIRREVVEKVKSTYFQLSYIQQTLGFLQRNDRSLGDIEQIVESRYRVGQGNQQEVLRAQLQHTKILQEITMHHRQEGQLESQLKQLLNRAQDSPDVVAEPLRLHSIPYTAPELFAQARQQNPNIRARYELVRKAEAQTGLAHREFRPDFNVQYMYQRTASQFRDYYMATFGVTLPNRGRRSAELAEATEKWEQANKELEAETQRNFAEIQNQYVLAQTSAEQLKIYKEGLIPQSEATFRSALAAYQSNRQDFQTLISSFLDTLNLDLEFQRELAEHESALAKIEALTGVTLR